MLDLKLHSCCNLGLYMAAFCLQVEDEQAWVKMTLSTCQPGLERRDPTLDGAKCRMLVLYVVLWEASGF